MFALACMKLRTTTAVGLRDSLPLPPAFSRRLCSSPLHCTFPLCFDGQNKIKWFIPSEHNNIYNHRHPSVATCSGPFLYLPQASISI